MVVRGAAAGLSRRRLLALAGGAATGGGLLWGAARERGARSMSGTSGVATNGLFFPPREGDAWETVAPAEAGWDARRLEEALTFAGENASTAMVVLWRGRLLAERYWRDWDLHSTGAIASCQKSVTSLLAGIAQHAGLLRLEDRVTDALGRGWSRATAAEEDAITLRHLLTMTSGLDDGLRFQASPGTRWAYNTPAYYRSKAMLERAAGVSLTEYTRRVLWEPLGMRDSSWRGEILAPPPGQQLHSSARDMARFGLMALAGGTWDSGTVVEDAGYLKAALSPSQALNPAYGYLWWLNGSASFLLPGARAAGVGPFVPAAPPDMVAALGAADKKIYVVPSLELVVTRHGGAAGRDRSEALSSFDNQLWERLMAAAP